jgi:GTP-binding protein
VLFASALQGWASHGTKHSSGDMTALFQTIVDRVPPPDVDPTGRSSCR